MESASGPVSGTASVSVVGPHGKVHTDLDASVSLSDQILKIHAEVGDPDRPANECMLLAPWRGTYITAELWLEGLPTWLETEDARKHALKLVVKPGLEVREILQELRGSRDRDAAKRLVFNLDAQLKVGLFAEEFVAQKGLTVLLELVNKEDEDDEGAPTKQSSALVAYSLQSLRTALCWQSAMWQMGHEEAYLLFELLYSTHAKVRACSLPPRVHPCARPTPPSPERLKL